MKIVISGATSGFGVAWLRELDDTQQAEFFVLARDRQKFDALVAQHPLKNPVHFICCDLSSLASIERASGVLRQTVESVDVLINNAGVYAKDALELSSDNIEMTFAVNQLAPYYLTGKLLPLLCQSAQPRIVNTASFRHSDAKLNTSDIELISQFNAENAYCNSKLFTILFTRYLAELLKDTTISVNCFDPGMVDTPMLRQAFPKSLLFLYPLVRRLIARSCEKGAQTGVFLSIADACDGVTGQYFKDKKVKKTSKQAYSKALARWLWRECERLSGYCYPTLSPQIPHSNTFGDVTGHKKCPPSRWAI
ncbi:SDR family NAD(P)-dependent oxidoreductase [Pseudoalteromonas sp. MMG022]|uniref:SDR family NAD(P)-dependent oxidoreductase n=1 Tax=Pseudoalteromonas sp. MMG022 TaxID=2909978 RepID=UPI001F3E5E04|nr:SDR family NAD(P)-dependent oxidoreductase [Pseudoalteromonas sp. MMG022]MCF6437500.1 SDR family NAD(P)-dependent oxidoreductase [Pseudoalteromonas sp. MMG022]